MSPGDEAKANRAAEEVTAYESQSTAIKVDLSAIRGELTLLKWMLASLLGVNLAVALKLFLH